MVQLLHIKVSDSMTMITNRSNRIYWLIVNSILVKSRAALMGEEVKVAHQRNAAERVRMIIGNSIRLIQRTKMTMMMKMMRKVKKRMRAMMKYLIKNSRIR